ncbi:unnamed protein product [Prorocentrum cordatum]|uniref:Uncharacterized protein n=1 Tax=Prorocentrum cordatum TaxID=2364126 RepID=A0ABN9T633_9DINO|nr:unnamed protein product [Polarella glacialis]
MANFLAGLQSRAHASDKACKRAQAGPKAKAVGLCAGAVGLDALRGPLVAAAAAPAAPSQPPYADSVPFGPPLDALLAAAGPLVGAEQARDLRQLSSDAAHARSCLEPVELLRAARLLAASAAASLSGEAAAAAAVPAGAARGAIADDHGQVLALLHSSVAVARALLSLQAALLRHRAECFPWGFRRPLLDGLLEWASLARAAQAAQWCAVHYGDAAGGCWGSPGAARPKGAPIRPADGGPLELLRAIAELIAGTGPYGAGRCGDAGASEAAADGQLPSVQPDNLGRTGVFDNHEWLRRTSKKKRLMAQVLREILAGAGPVQEDPGDGGVPVLLDLGAGAGGYAAFLNRTGLVRHLDLSEPLPRRGAPEPAAWVLCLEVRLYAVFCCSNLGSLVGHALVLSWAPPEKCGLGWGHLNCRDPPAVEGLLSSIAGLVKDEEGTLRLRAAAELPWLRGGVLMLRRGREPEARGAPRVVQHLPLPSLCRRRCPLPFHHTVLP